MLNNAEWPSLIEFVKELKLRVSMYSEEYKRNRELVKNSLVMPFIRLMGWDPENPEEVKPGYKTRLGEVDYAIFVNGDGQKILVVVGELENLPDAKEHLKKCIDCDAKFLLLTDGYSWSVYQVENPNSPVLTWSLSNNAKELFKAIDSFRQLLGIETGKYEEIICYTNKGRKVVVKILEDMGGIILRRNGKSGIPYSHLAKMIRSGKAIFLSGSGIDNKNITYIRKRLEKEVGAELECTPAIYYNEMGYSIMTHQEEK